MTQDNSRSPQSEHIAALFHSPSQLYFWCDEHRPDEIAGQAVKADKCPISEYVRARLKIPEDQLVSTFSTVSIADENRTRIENFVTPPWLFSVVQGIDRGHLTNGDVTFKEFRAAIDAVMIRIALTHIIEQDQAAAFPTTSS